MDRSSPGKPQRPRNATAVATRRVTRWVKELQAKGGVGMERDRTESSAAINTTSITAAGDDTADIVSGDGGPILPGGGVLTATEVECNIPGCAPIETVVAFYSAAEDAPNFAAKILKPIADVTREEAAEAVADLRAQAQDFLEQQIKPQQGEMGEVRGIGERKKAGGGEQTGQVLDEKEEHQQQGQQQQRQEQEETKEDNSIEKVRRTSGGRPWRRLQQYSLRRKCLFQRRSRSQHRFRQTITGSSLSCSDSPRWGACRQGYRRCCGSSGSGNCVGHYRGKEAKRCGVSSVECLVVSWEVR